MKRTLLLLLISFLLGSCWYTPVSDDNAVGETFESAYEPLSMKRETFETTITVGSARDIANAGKIYVNGDIVFINEMEKGFHVLDNTNPEEPKNIAFIEIPLATDLAIRNNTIYVHHAVDLVSMRFNQDEVEILHRERNVFPPLNSPDGFPAQNFDLEEDQIIIGYQLKN